jgi:hypothetical protein
LVLVVHIALVAHLIMVDTVNLLIVLPQKLAVEVAVMRLPLVQGEFTTLQMVGQVALVVVVIQVFLVI